MRMRRSLALAAISAGALLTVGAPAGAHVGIQQSEAAAGASTVLSFVVPHGCDGSPTTEVAIQIPESILTVTPTRNPYYDVTVETEPLEESVEGSHGETISERDAVVVFSAREPLPDGIRDVLDVSMTIPADAEGQTLYFPTLQTCETGEEAWITIPEEGQDPHDVDSPAPGIVVVANAGGGHDHADVGADHDDAGDHGDDGSETTSSDDDAETAATDDTAEDGADEQAQAPASDDADDGTDVLTIVALVVAVIAAALGGVALVASRKTSGSGS